MDDVVIRPLTWDLVDDYLEFFDRRAFSDNEDWSGCYCFFPYHDPQESNWKDRSAAENREAIADAIKQGSASGFLAYSDDRVVGWCNAAPRMAYPALRGLPGEPSTTGATPCFIVDPDWRGRGVAARLLGVACDALRDDGMLKMEAGPNRNAKTASHNSRGPVSMYLSAGYEIVNEFPDGTVLVEKTL